MNDDDHLAALYRELQAISTSRRYDHIADVSTRILAIAPSDEFAMLMLISAQYGKAKTSKSDDDFRIMYDTIMRALRSHPEQAAFYYRLHDYYLWYGGEFYIQSRDALLKAIKLSPLNAHYFRSLGEIYLINREADKAVKHLRHAVKLAPDVAEYRSRLALALMRQGRIEESMEVGAKALSEDPDDDQVLDNVGMLYILTGDLDKAERFFRDAIKRNPTYNYFHQHQDWIKREQSDRAARLKQGRKYVPLYIRQKQTKRFFDEDGEVTVALHKGPS